jgi:phage pi2 protein 07
MHWVIEFGYVFFWFVSWQLFAFIYKKLIKFINKRFKKDFDHDI